MGPSAEQDLGASDQTRTRSGPEFGEVARTYDPARPGYPSELVDDALTWPPGTASIARAPL